MFDSKAIAKATDILKSNRVKRETELASRRSRVYESHPKIRELDSRKRRAALDAILRAVREGSDASESVSEVDFTGLSNEIGNALEASGYPRNYLEPELGCKICSDSGYTESGMCRCLAALCSEIQLETIKTSAGLADCSFDKFSDEYYSGDTDPRFDMSPKENIGYIRDICMEFAASFGKDCVNLFMNGGVGLGKTFMSGCVAISVAERGFHVIYETAGVIMAKFEQERFARSDDGAGEDTRRYLSCDLLIIDDLGSEFSTQFYTSALYSIVNTRITRRLPTIISSNLTMDELNRRYTAQIMSRLAGEYHTLTFFGEDIRIQRKRRSYEDN